MPDDNLYNWDNLARDLRIEVDEEIIDAEFEDVPPALPPGSPTTGAADKG